MSFDDIKISQDLKSALSSAVCSGHFPHASIFEDEDNERGLETAKAVARALICEGSDKPCGRCPACIKALSNSHPDIKLFEGGDTPRSFKVETVREIRSDAYIMPNEANRKIYILNKAQNMSEQAQNALLKVLEEPPENVVFMLLTPDKNAFLQTILSRCCVFSQQGGRRVSDEAKEAARKLARAIPMPNEYTLMSATAPFEKDKDLLRAALPELKEILREAMLTKVGSNLECQYEEESRKLSSKFTLSNITKMIDCTDDIISSINRNENYNLLLTRLCADLRRASGR